MITKKIDFTELLNSLHYLHVSELKSYCEKFILSTKGKKIALISRIIHFLKTGEKTDLPKYPNTSVARGSELRELKPDTLILKGAYKNDLKTRIFFKGLVGEHFHFTAFGIDWLEERWMQGKPPTYQEFAEMWKKEYEFRKVNGSIPKEEWAYINFVKRYLSKNQKASREEILKQWETERNNHKDSINKIFA
jgi:hypothetical protein